MAMTEWRLTAGEWELTRFVRTMPEGGYVRRAVYLLSPNGPPFRYRVWNREGKDWDRFTLDHVTNIEEAKACLAVSLRMQ
jgi:hypothetical protein